MRGGNKLSAVARLSGVWPQSPGNWVQAEAVGQMVLRDATARVPVACDKPSLGAVRDVLNVGKTGTKTGAGL